MLEARGVRLAQALVAGQQVACHQLEVLEVERRSLALRACVALAVQLQENAQHGVVAVLALRNLERPVRGESLAVLLARVGVERLRLALDLAARIDALDSAL